jgi:RNA polymerase sigma-70 factor (ECF subfamily)
MSNLQSDFERLYAQAYWRLVGQLTVITGDPQTAQDAVQEALFRAWARWATVGHYDDPEAWVRRVAINVATSSWRKVRRLVPTATPHHIDMHPGVEQSAESLDLLASIARVPRREREALVLFYVADLSVREVADSMGIRVGSAKALLSRGRQRLHQMLSDADSKGRTHAG